MKPLRALAAAGLLMLSSSSASANEGNSFNAKLTGFQETPSILTNGKGTFTSRLNATATELSYTLSYSGLSTDALVAHIHFAQRGVAGGVVVFLCGGGGKPACPPSGGSVSDTITAVDVLEPLGQGITAGSFSDLLAALRSGNTYVNVHTTNHVFGEIRGQIPKNQNQDQD